LGADPEVLKVDEEISTDSGGNYSLADLEWDAYALPVLSGYDLVGSIPILPISLPPGVTQPVQLLVGANTSNSLLVNVSDNMTNQPISNASVRVYAGSYDQTKTTGIGFARQTDWSGGSGQLAFTDETKYWSDNGKVDVDSSAGDITLAKLGEEYFSSGELESSVFDLGASVNFVNLIWEPLGQPAETGDSSVRWQIATSPSSTPVSWNYLGHDGTAGTHYDAQHVAVNEVHNGDRYFRYKLFLSTETAASTPIISDLLVTYTNACTPPGQSYFGGLSATDYTVEISKAGYQTNTQTVSVSGDMIFGAEMASE
ncbi:MAG: hypothetical protein HY980_01855, partial [Candidatus Magasanikbacteria bacterium]|nr:hypothetical protein [Candidatus Magasanikbacteria bacterium]